MQSSAAPSRIQIPFANSGAKNTIPVPSQISADPALASYTDGFPPATRTAIAAGGKAPYGTDMNGILNAITSIQQWQSAGGLFKYDSAFSTAIGGYPKGAQLISSSGNRTWVNLVEGNTTDPDSASAAGWITGAGGLSYLSTSLTVSGAQTLPLSALGGLVNLTGASYTATLPAVSACPIGSTYTFVCSVSGTVTLAAASGDNFSSNFGPALQIQAGDTLTVMNAGSGYWWVISGSVALKKASGFAATIATNGYQKLPSGLILQWGQFTQTDNGTAVPYSFTLPVQFPNAGLHAYVTPASGNGAGGISAPTVETVNQNICSGFTYAPSGSRPYRIFAIGY